MPALGRGPRPGWVKTTDLDGAVTNYLVLFDAWLAAGPHRDELLVGILKDDALNILRERTQPRWDPACIPRHRNSALVQLMSDTLD